jgi:hypothetical protein
MTVRKKYLMMMREREIRMEVDWIIMMICMIVMMRRRSIRKL